MQNRPRPLSVHLVDVATLTLRRCAHLAVIAAVCWAPACWALHRLLTDGVRIPTLVGLFSTVDQAPTAQLTGVLADPQSARIGGIAFAGLALLALLVSTGAFAHQLHQAAAGTPAGAHRSLWRAFSRLHRLLLAVCVPGLLVVTPLAVGAVTVGWMVWMDPQGGLEAARTAAIAAGLVAVICAWAVGRLALWPVAAVMSPHWRMTVLAALRATGRRWWAVSWRLWSAALMSAAVAAAVIAPLSVMAATGTSQEMTGALVGAVAVTGCALAYIPATLALVYADVTRPDRDRARAAATPVAPPLPDVPTAAPEAQVGTPEDAEAAQGRDSFAELARQRIADLA